MIGMDMDASGVTGMLARLAGSLQGGGLAGLNGAAGDAALRAAVEYHSQFAAGGGWRSRSSSMGSSGGDFGAEIAAGWMLKADGDGVTLSNAAPLLRFKVYGGTITPKSAKALTIPLVPEARGLRAAQYASLSGRRLFTIPGRAVLFERLDDGGGGSGGGKYGIRRSKGAARAATPSRNRLRAVYALVTSVTQGPWPGAMPPDESVSAPFADAWREGLSAALGD